MYCRDCGEYGEMFGSSGLRSDICKRCMDTRRRVLKAVESGAMTIADFQAYQRPGLRTKRLQKLGYWTLVDTVPQGGKNMTQETERRIKTMEEAAELPGVSIKPGGLNLHFSPLPNWYACVAGLDCPRCTQGISWSWSEPLPSITTRAPGDPDVKGANLVSFGHRYIEVKCFGCDTTLFAENFD